MALDEDMLRDTVVVFRISDLRSLILSVETDSYGSAVGGAKAAMYDAPFTSDKERPAIPPSDRGDNSSSEGIYLVALVDLLTQPDKSCEGSLPFTLKVPTRSLAKTKLSTAF